MNLKNILERENIEIFTGKIKKVNKDSIYTNTDSTTTKEGGEISTEGLILKEFKKGDPVILVYNDENVLPDEVYHGKTGEAIFISKYIK